MRLEKHAVMQRHATFLCKGYMTGVAIDGTGKVPTRTTVAIYNKI